MTVASIRVALVQLARELHAPAWAATPARPTSRRRPVNFEDSAVSSGRAMLSAAPPPSNVLPHFVRPTPARGSWAVGRDPTERGVAELQNEYLRADPESGVRAKSGELAGWSQLSGLHVRQ